MAGVGRIGMDPGLLELGAGTVFSDDPIGSGAVDLGSVRCWVCDTLIPAWRLPSKEPRMNVGDTAAEFTLTDHFGREISGASFRGAKNVLLLFYPLDWTPT